MVMIPISVVYTILGFVLGVISFIILIIFINKKAAKQKELNFEKLRKALDELSEISKDEDK